MDRRRVPGRTLRGAGPFGELLAPTGLGLGPATNGGRPPVDLDALKRRLPEAVANAHEWIIARRDAFEPSTVASPRAVAYGTSEGSVV